MTGTSCRSRRWVVWPMAQALASTVLHGASQYRAVMWAFVGRGGSTLLMAVFLGLQLEQKFVLMLPEGLCYIWQRNSITGQSKKVKKEAKYYI